MVADVKVLREVAFKIDEDADEDKKDSLPVIASVGFVKDEVYDGGAVEIKQEPPMDDEDEDRAHDEMFGGEKMEVEPANDDGPEGNEGQDDATDDVMLMDDGTDGNGEDQVRVLNKLNSVHSAL